MSYKVLVLDIDGTLTNSKKQISPATKRALLGAQKKGVKVVLASGRPTQGIKPLADELELDRFGGYVLSFNGAVVTNYETKEVIYRKELPMEEVSSLYQSSRKYGLPIVSYQGDSIVSEIVDDEYVEIEARINQMPVVKVDNFVETIKDPVPKCLMVGEGNYLATVEKEVNEAFGDRLNVYRSEPFFLEIMPQNIDKAYSLGKLLDYLGLSKDEMIACGDGFNDLSMIKYAGLGVAMGNAQPIVKESADYVTLTNDEDGVASVVNEFIFN
ncbi:MAG: HAD family phosphatase [Paludibacteraceae bacterium]|nr:HAD family phosphatase [Paludibacteraceae bacterium]MBP5458449.1 HAD family phosphatase [Paludibacteraceae bacterium]MBR4840833.1 HAD family phosphatase [Paludibacteraceae bacterium]